MPKKDLAGKNLARANLDWADLAGADPRDATLRDAYARDADLSGADLRDVDLTGLKVNPDVSLLQAAKNNGHRPGVPRSLAGRPTRSNVESVVAIKVDGEPCCVEILVAGIDRSAVAHEAVPGIPAIAEDEGLVVLTLDDAQALHARLDAAIRALAASGGSRRK